jgi:DNA polymerase-3 subunit epsilon
MQSWIDGPVIGFDTETTGVDVATDRVVTAAVVRRVGSAETVSTWLLDPGIEIPEAASAIHGVTSARARAEGRPARQALDEIAQALADGLLRGEPIVAFNASFDLSLLETELQRHHLPTLGRRISGPLRVVIDPLVLDRHLDRHRRGKRKLVDLCGHYGVRSSAALHAADADTKATLDVLRAITAAYPELTQTPLGQLHDLQVAAHRSWAQSLNAWRASKGLTGPGAELEWPVRDGLAYPAVGAQPEASPVAPVA